MNKIQSVRYSLVDIMNQSGITGVIVKMSAFYQTTKVGPALFDWSRMIVSGGLLCEQYLTSLTINKFRCTEEPLHRARLTEICVTFCRFVRDNENCTNSPFVSSSNKVVALCDSIICLPWRCTSSKVTTMHMDIAMSMLKRYIV